MSSYLSNLLTTTSTRYASLRNLLPTGEADGDTPDDTHICRVLRAYYIEKGRVFPPWLPPDPKVAPPPQVQQQNYGAPVGAGYGNLANAGSSGNKLTSLWDNKASSGSPAPQVNQSLRQGRAGGSPALRAGGGMQRGQQQQQQEYVAARPLPSQRDGSYQNSPALQPTTSAGSAQDRLKQRLWGGAKSNSSSQSSLDQVQGQPQGRSPGRSPGMSPQPPPQGGGFERQDSYNSGRSGMSANSPWSQDNGGQEQYGRQERQDPRRQGLPSNPRGYR
ncbi:hypothetical protein VE03_02647 [Pseudogymnoascus sp. 23342-1-I1]|nr:hypothetical protein VE03_02647 [Pseudogymnoascus sp. 23342-1-I1]